MTSISEVTGLKVWEIKVNSVNDHAPLVFVSEREAASGWFDVSGTPLMWPKRPRVEVFIEPGKKKPKPLSDVSALMPGALAMNSKAKAVLEPFLETFGQFLELDCQGLPYWFYNVTHVVPCIDEARSTKKPSGAISREAFLEDQVPAGAVVFKDPRTAPASIYVTDAGKAVLEALTAESGITGLAFVEPGPGPKRVRPSA